MTIQWNTDNGIGHLRLNLPPANTMTMAFFRELNLLVSEISNNRDLKAIIISGNGRHFSSGADISELLANVDGQLMLENYRTFVMLEQLEIPVISAIRGVCLGSAFELALFSHFRLCAGDAVLGLPESSFNLMPGLGGIQRVAELAGNATALDLILRGATFSAADALEMKLVDCLVPKNELYHAATGFANAIHGSCFKNGRSALLLKHLKLSNAKS